MAYSKVILNGTTLIDLTQDTIENSKVLNGYTGKKNDGTAVTGNIATKTESDVTHSNTATVTVPAGYYATQVQKTVKSGSATTPTDTVTVNTITPSFSSNKLQISCSGSKSITPTVSAGWVASGTAGTVSASGTASFEYLELTKANSFRIDMQANTTTDNTKLTINNANYRNVFIDNKVTTNSKISIKAKEISTATSVGSEQVVVENGYWKTWSIGTTTNNVYDTKYGKTIVYNGSATTPATTIPVTPTASISSNKLIVSCSGTQQVTPTVSAGYIASGTAGTITVTGSTEISSLTIPASNSFNITVRGTLNATSYSNSAGTITISAYPASGSIESGKTIVSGGKWQCLPNAVNASGIYYGKVDIPHGSMQASVSSNTAGSASMTATGMATSVSSTSYYVTLSTAPGSVKAKAHCNSAGYITTSTSEDNETAATSVNVSGDGDVIYIPAAVGSVTMTPGNGSCTYSTDSNTGSKNITVSDTDTSGIKFVAIGSGELSATAKITTSGYAPQTAQNSSFASGSSTSSNSATLTKYVTGVKIEKPNSGNRSFDIEVPNGYINSVLQYITFHFTVDSDGNTVIT